MEKIIFDKKQNNKENEGDFEIAKKEISDFLATPHQDFCEQNKIDDAKVDSRFVVLEKLRQKFSQILPKKFGQQPIEFLESLVINDSLDESKMPNIFRDGKKNIPGNDYKEGNSEDIFEGWRYD